MAFVPFENVVKAVLNWHNELGSWHNIMHFWLPGFDADDMLQLANDLMSELRTTYKDYLADSTYLDSVDVYDLTSDEGPIIRSTGGAVAGLEATTQVVPIGAALCITLYTTSRGRSGRGRLYLTGFTEMGLVNGVWVAALVEEAEDQIGAYREGALSPWTLVLANRYKDGDPLTLGTFKYVSSVVCRSSIITVQHRRDARP